VNAYNSGPYGRMQILTAIGKVDDGNCNVNAPWLIGINTELETEKVSETFRRENEK
jgi:hypothetical protein